MDIDALVTHIQANLTRYDAALTSGSNTELHALLNEAHPTVRRWRDIQVGDFLDVLSQATLTSAQEDRVRTYVASGLGFVPTSKASVRQWLQTALTGQTAVIAALASLGDVSATWAESDGTNEGTVSLNDVREAVRRIPTSFIRATGQRGAV